MQQAFRAVMARGGESQAELRSVAPAARLQRRARRGIILFGFPTLQLESGRHAQGEYDEPDEQEDYETVRWHELIRSIIPT